MIKNYNITINNNKEIFCDEEIHINFLENEVTTLTFTVPSELDDFSSVCVLETPTKKKKTLPISNNTLIISNEVSFAIGNWNLIFYSVKDDIVFVSNKLSFKVEKNYLDKEESEEMDANVEILYLELLEKMKTLDTLDLDNLETMNTDIQTIKNTTNNIISLSSQILEIVNYNKTMLNNINAKIDNNLSVTGSINNKIGDNDTKADGTLFNYSYWGLVRSEEAKFNTQAIISLLTDADTLADEILEELEG